MAFVINKWITHAHGLGKDIRERYKNSSDFLLNLMQQMLHFLQIGLAIVITNKSRTVARPTLTNFHQSIDKRTIRSWFVERNRQTYQLMLPSVPQLQIEKRKSLIS